MSLKFNKYKSKFVNTWSESPWSTLINKCEEPKLFYRFIYGKMKHKESIMLYRNFQSVFTKETKFTQVQKGKWRIMEMQEVTVQTEEIHHLIKNREERKAAELDEESRWILNECTI